MQPSADSRPSYYIASVDGIERAGSKGWLDITHLPDGAEVVITRDRIWINAPNCLVRICQIEGEIVLKDMRNPADECAP